MLMMVILAILGDAHRRESLAVERGVISAAQEAVGPENQHGLERWRQILGAHLADVARLLAGKRIAFRAQGANGGNRLQVRRLVQRNGAVGFFRGIYLWR